MINHARLSTFQKSESFQGIFFVVGVIYLNIGNARTYILLAGEYFKDLKRACQRNNLS